MRYRFYLPLLVAFASLTLPALETLETLEAAAPPLPRQVIELPDVQGRMHTPLNQPDTKAVVLFFLLVDCPISNAYSPEISRICADYVLKKVATFIVHADPDLSPAEAQKHAKDYGLKSPLLLDPRHQLVQRAGVTIAPEVAVFDAAGTLCYRGRIDDLYVDLGKRRATPTQRDLRIALDALLEGKPIPTPRTRALGCYLPTPQK